MTNKSPNIENATPSEQDHAEAPVKNNSDWLLERKQEVREVLEKKSRELSKRAQQHLSEKLGHYESALSSASDKLEEENEPQPANMTRDIARRVRKTAEYFENTEPEEIVEATAKKVKKTPLIALGGALAAGFLVGRLLASANDENASNATEA